MAGDTLAPDYFIIGAPPNKCCSVAGRTEVALDFLKLAAALQHSSVERHCSLDAVSCCCRKS